MLRARPLSDSAAATARPVAPAASPRAPGPFAGLGAWVDAFDYAPAFQNDGGAVTVSPAAVPDMAALGKRFAEMEPATAGAR